MFRFTGIRFHAAVFAALLIAACGCERQERISVRAPAAEGKLIFATSIGNPPYADRDASTGEIVGIDIDLARAAADRLKMDLIVESMDFGELLPQVKAGLADFAGAAITITESRERDVDFSHSYAYDGSAFLYRRDAKRPAITRSDRFRIGVQDGSLGQFYLCHHGVDPIAYPDYAGALAAFRAGKIDAVFHDAASIRDTVAAEPETLAITPLVTRERYGIAVRKDFSELKRVLDAIIAERETEP